MGVAPRPDEPVIIYTVRQIVDELREDFQKGLAALSAKLDDRVTIGAFTALRADLDAARQRIDALEDAADKSAAHDQGVQAVLGWLLRFGGWLVATALGVAWIWITVSHG